MKLEDIKKDAQITGIKPGETVRIIQVEPIGDDTLTVYYKDSQGNTDERMIFRSDEASFSLTETGKPWSFTASGDEFKLALESLRIQLAHLFDPMMAIHTSNIQPLPHQISAVYEVMLSRQPLRFVLADDPGAGKTIMAGLLIRELLIRADAQRILIVAPGSLTEQWQDEMHEKFGVDFELFSREKMEQSSQGNYFEDQGRLICRIDQLSRNEDYLERLKNTDWDLIIVDEAHKLAATYSGQNVKKTKRFKLGELLSQITRHFLLMTATPHNGKEEDFQIWLSLLDGDRFFGKFREGTHQVDVSDVMRRMVKEELLKFDGKRLFPERRAYSVNYTLSDLEADLYTDVTKYVREEMNRAEKHLDKKKKGTVGFALTQLQRRLASSPEAIYQSLKRRRKRLETRLEEMKLIARGEAVQQKTQAETLKTPWGFDPEDFDDIDDELNAEEYEEFAEEVVDQATAAKTVPELEAEIAYLKALQEKASTLVASGNDRKWEELSRILQEQPEMKGEGGHRRKLIIFTEHKDTLYYLQERISGLLGKPQAVIVIHGAVNRDDRRKAQEMFRNDPDVLVLIATDAAGEGVNLQNANLMVNYDLPWNPNRLEQRFGRIHRIGQTEVCHLWNLVANETREGSVFQKLFEKLEIERQALGGKVFDILGEAFQDRSLKDLLMEAIRYGDQPEIRARLDQVIEGALDTKHLEEIIRRNALVDQHMSMEDLFSVKEEMEKAEARKLQPHFIRSYFQEAFPRLNGEVKEREKNRYEIKHVPASIRERDRIISETRTPVLKKYERICFEKELIRVYRKPVADLVHPGHPLMKAITSLMLDHYRKTLKEGTVLVNPQDLGTEPRVLFMIDHTIREGETSQNIVASRRLQFVEIDRKGAAFHGGWAPHLDLIPLKDEDEPLAEKLLEESWVNDNLDGVALQYAVKQLVPEHYKEVKTRREMQADKTLKAVQERLVKEINYLSNRANELQELVKAGKQPQVQPQNLRRRADELAERLKNRQREITASKNVVSNTPVIVGGALVIPQGWFYQQRGETEKIVDAQAKARVEKIAMDAVVDAERRMGNSIKDVSADNCGWDISSQPPFKEDQELPPTRHIEVKGRTKGQPTITVSKNEIMSALNQSDKFILAIVLVEGDLYEGPYYCRQPFIREPEAGVTSINYNLSELLKKSVKPEETV